MHILPGKGPLPTAVASVRPRSDVGMPPQGPSVEDRSGPRLTGVAHNVININDFEFAFVEIELK